MNREEAIERLKKHAFVHDDLEDEKMTKGFLGMLRPFDGTLIEANFHELMDILNVLADDLEQGELDRTLISCLWSICQYARAWALEPDGMLRRNELIADEQLQQMAQWVDMISYTTMVLLEGGGREDAFWSYHEYVKEQERIRSQS
ncbi:hypothetical protein B9G55_03415 [Saccharibacillus sp. O16]|nr:hypothetical protein B9G55_03415 [Saccharibacillus sp. O16]